MRKGESTSKQKKKKMEKTNESILYRRLICLNLYGFPQQWFFPLSNFITQFIEIAV